jgi:hypothetical protein
MHNHYYFTLEIIVVKIDNDFFFIYIYKVGPNEHVLPKKNMGILQKIFVFFKTSYTFSVTLSPW